MKTTFFSVVALIFIFTLSGYAQAPREFPFTMGVDDSDSFIDIDGDGLADVYVKVYCYNCDSERDCAIQLQDVYGDAWIVKDFHAVDVAQDAKTVSGFASYYAEYFDEGDEIGEIHETNFVDFVKIRYWWGIPADARPDNFQSNTEGYIGVRFRANKTIGDAKQLAEYNYGWIEVSVDNVNHEITFVGTGYQPEVGDPIAAGDLPVTPIPLIASLLGFGVIGVTAMRKRFKK